VEIIIRQQWTTTTLLHLRQKEWRCGRTPPLFTSDDDHPAPDAKRPCLDNAPNDDIDDDDIDDDEWTSCSMSDRSSSTDSELTELIKNGIKENGGDEYVDEVADHHGVIITFEDASTSIARLEIDITEDDYTPASKQEEVNKKRANKNLLPSEKANVPKLSNLPSSFTKSGFFDNKSLASNKITPQQMLHFRGRLLYYFESIGGIQAYGGAN